MLMMLVLLAYALVSALGSWHARYREQRGKHPGFYFDFWKHTAGNLQTGPVLLFALAAATTWGMVALGWDQSIQIFFQTENPLGRCVPWIVLIGGSFWHMALAVFIYFHGKWKADFRQMGAGLAGIQALLINTLLNTGQKILSGRQGPDYLLDNLGKRPVPFKVTKDPANFSFDFWNHTHGDGRFMWPSGHTTAIFAFVSALRTYYPEKRWIPWVGYPFALFTGLAMVDGDFHWASDVVAGALLGEVTGRIVGRGFRRRYRPPQPAP
jgi:membrane-associated phospholipid phosphatase